MIIKYILLAFHDTCHKAICIVISLSFIHAAAAVTTAAEAAQSCNSFGSQHSASIPLQRVLGKATLSSVLGYAMPTSEKHIDLAMCYVQIVLGKATLFTFLGFDSPSPEKYIDLALCYVEPK